MSSDKHQCGPCSLCKRTSTRYFHTDSWDSDKYMHFIKHVVPPSCTVTKKYPVCICRACYHDLNTNVGNDNHTPRWKRHKLGKPVELSPCDVQGCTNNGEFHTIAITSDNIPDEVTLSGQSSKYCSVHYHAIYNHQHQTKCTTCGKKASSGEKMKSCPNPHLIERYLRATAQFASSIKEGDRICHSCYKKYNEVISIHKTLTKVNDQDGCESEGLVSLNSDLDIVITNLKQKAQSLDKGSEALPLTTTTIMVAETIRNEQAIMLPAVFTYYNSRLNSTFAKHSSRWLLQQIQEALGHHLKSVCKHKKYGTVLYRAGGDLLQALSAALGSKCTSAFVVSLSGN